MSGIILIRHAAPEIDASRPSDRWPLSAEGRRAARELGFALGGLNPGRVVVSPEAKAWETGAEIAAVLDLGVTVHDGLREQGGDAVPWIADPAEFKDLVRAHFARRDDVVLGAESAAGAAARMQAAIEAIAADEVTAGPLLLVSHGRILVSWIAGLLGETERAFAIWSGLRLPDAFLADRERREIQRIA